MGGQVNLLQKFIEIALSHKHLRNCRDLFLEAP